MRDLLVGLGQASALLVVQPAVIVTAEPALLDEPIRKIGAPMRTVPVQEPVRPALVPVEDQILAEKPYGLGGSVLELGDAGDAHPVPPQELAHGPCRPDCGQRP